MDYASDQSQPTLYAHKKRKEWGRALLLWERNEKRGYLFEDGQEKVLARGFYGLMEELAVSQEEFDALQTRLGVTAQGSHSKPTAKPSISFHDQLEVFKIEYPEGFDSDEWKDKLRGKPGVRRIKRHRDAAIADAQARLSQEAVQNMLAQQQYRHLWDTAMAVLTETDLVPGSVTSKLSTSNAEHLKALAEGLVEMLYGEEAFDQRFDRFARAFKIAFRVPSWQLVTAFSALVKPNEHVCIRPASLREQIKQMAPGLTLERYPSSIQYTTLLGVATRVQDKLKSAGEQPADLFDVYDFVRVTTRPAAKRVLSEDRNSTNPAASKPDGDGDTEAA
jgi:hypothetical protein